MNNLRDPETGRFVRKAEELEAQAKELTVEAQSLREKADIMIANEKNPPRWLKNMVVAIADALGITSEEFNERVKVIHPTPADPVLLIDGKSVIAWV